MKKARQFLCAAVALLTAVIMLSEPFQTEVQAAKTISTSATTWVDAPTFKKKGSYNINARANNKQYKHGLETLKTKSNGGKAYTLILASKWWYSRYVKGQKVTPESELYSRYSKLSLKKGDVLYISTYWSNGKHQYKLKIQ